MTEVPPDLSAYLSEIGRRGGKKKVAKGFAALTPAQRTKLAKKAAKAKWSRIKKKAV